MMKPEKLLRAEWTFSERIVPIAVFIETPIFWREKHHSKYSFPMNETEFGSVMNVNDEQTEK
jgi:hypothetical protein